MVSCLVLYHMEITISTKCKMLRFYFHGKEYEIAVENNNSVCIYLWNIDRNQVYQAAMLFEHEGLSTGYGFGKDKSEAHHRAWQILFQRALEDGRIREGNVAYRA